MRGETGRDTPGPRRRPNEALPNTRSRYTPSPQPVTPNRTTASPLYTTLTSNAIFSPNMYSPGMDPRFPIHMVASFHDGQYEGYGAGSMNPRSTPVEPGRGQVQTDRHQLQCEQQQGHGGQRQTHPPEDVVHRSIGTGRGTRQGREWGGTRRDDNNRSMTMGGADSQLRYSDDTQRSPLPWSRFSSWFRRRHRDDIVHSERSQSRSGKQRRHR
jgi:hypothetical protein